MLDFEILLVDDSAADARLFETALVESGSRARVYWVTTGREALEYLHGRGRFQEAGPVKLVVLDLNLPGDSGVEVLQAIRKDPVIGSVPVVIFTTSRSPQEVARAYAAGANSYVVKPMSFASLVDGVRILVRYWFDLVMLQDRLV